MFVIKKTDHPVYKRFQVLASEVQGLKGLEFQRLQLSGGAFIRVTINDYNH